jgi:RimJ/RimL family protein N-acetyltransferase
LSPKGKTILTLPSTAKNETTSRIVPFLTEGAGTTLNRGDVHYVVTEHGIAYLHGKNIRERAMELISIAHPKFQPWLMEEAKKLNLIFKDQAFIPGKGGVYPQHLETHRTTKKGLNLFLRPVKISDEPLLKDLFYSLSEDSRYRRFVSARREMPHDFLQKFVVIDYTKQMAILAVIQHEEKEEAIGVGRYAILEDMHTADIAFVVRDDYQNKGVGTELFSYLTYIAKKKGVLGFTALVLLENQTMLHLIRKMGFDIEEKLEDGMYEIKMMFAKGGRLGGLNKEEVK